MSTDAELVVAASGGDRAAFGALYDRYADKVHVFAHGILRDESMATEALVRAFVRADRELDRLPHPAGFASWLFAIARSVAAELARTPGCGGRRRNWGPIGGRGRAEDAAALLWTSAVEFLPDEQALLELRFRAGFTGTSLAGAMGVEPALVDAMEARLRRRLARSVGSLLIARAGRDRCAALDELLRGWDGTRSIAIRRTVTDHTEGCVTCQATGVALADWATIAAAMPAPPAPASARSAVLDGGAPTRVEPTRTAAVRTGVAPAPPIRHGQDRSAPDSDWAADETGGRRRRAGIGMVAALVLSAIIVAWPGLHANGGKEVTTEVAGVRELSVEPADRSADAVSDAVPSPDAMASSTSTSSTSTSATSTSATGTVPVAGPPAGTRAATPAAVAPTTPAAAPPTTAPATVPATLTPPALPPPTVPPTAAPPATAAPTTTSEPEGPAEFAGATTPITFGPEVVVAAYVFANRGETTMAWSATVDDRFSVDPLAGTLVPGGSTSLTISLDAPAPTDAFTALLRLDTTGDGVADVEIPLVVSTRP